MAFSQKLLSYAITLQSGGGTINLSNLRSSCKIAVAGSPTAGGLADIAIYGMTLSQMNSATVLATETNKIGKNFIKVQAGDSSGMSLLYSGTILTGWADMKGMPETCFRISAFAGASEAVAPATPTSIQGSGDAAQISRQFSQNMALGFEDAGVKVKLSKPYFSGSYRTQMQTLAEHGGFQWCIDKDTLIICPNGQTRNGGPVMISPQTGMVGYPAFNQAGIDITTLFNPALKIFGKIQVQSQITPANGIWTIYNLAHDLESITPRGHWFTEIQAERIGQQEPGDQG